MLPPLLSVIAGSADVTSFLGLGLFSVGAGQLSVAAMAIQNAMGQLSLRKAPSTAVMTTNLTRFILDAGEALLGHDPAERAEARHRASDTWPVIIGFTAGASLGAACFAAVGPKALVLPAALALLALSMSLVAGLRADSKDGLLSNIQERS